MSNERTLSIIKPDGVSRGLIGKIIDIFESNSIAIRAAKMKTLTKKEAEGFYFSHSSKPFFGELVSYMCSGPVLLLVLEGNGVVEKNRKLMGATDPKKAETNTIRSAYGISLEKNTVHGSDSLTSSRYEISWFFPESEIF